MKNLQEILGPKLIEKIKQDNTTAVARSPHYKILHPDLLLFHSWAYRVGKGWYGFSLGNDAPVSWADAIGELLTELSWETPEFEIHQIKLKVGGLRFYVDLKLDECVKRDEIYKTIGELEALCFSKGLIY